MDNHSPVIHFSLRVCSTVSSQLKPKTVTGLQVRGTRTRYEDLARTGLLCLVLCHTKDKISQDAGLCWTPNTIHSTICLTHRWSLSKSEIDQWVGLWSLELLNMNYNTWSLYLLCMKRIISPSLSTFSWFFLKHNLDSQQNQIASF